MTAILSILTAISLLISNGYQIEKTTLYNDPCRCFRKLKIKSK